MRRKLHLSIAASAIVALGANGFGAYIPTNLVANSPAYNPTAFVDPNMINAWGIALRPPGAGGHIWISNADSGTTTTYIGDANGVPLYQDGLKVVPIVTSAHDQLLFETGSDGIAQVTGQVYNAASDLLGQPTEFFVSGPAKNYSNDTPAGVDAGSAKFVFVTMDGTINAWRTRTDPGMLEAVVIKDYSQTFPNGTANRAAYTGVAMTTDPYTLDAGNNKVANNRLYAADFGPNRRVQVFDNQWNDITTSSMFPRPAGVGITYHPFNIQQLSDGLIYVAWAPNAQEIDDPTEEIPGTGMGRIVAYDRDGNIVRDFADQSLLNAPWGLAIAPDDFGEFSGALLVANFGDGTIAAYNPTTTEALGYLRDFNGDAISIDGIWGLAFGNGVSLGDSNALYFTAGPDEERDGVFGSIRYVPEPSSTAIIAGVAALCLKRRRRV